MQSNVKVKRTNVKIKKLKMTKQYWKDINGMKCKKICKVIISRLKINAKNETKVNQRRKNLPDIRKYFIPTEKEKK